MLFGSLLNTRRRFFRTGKKVVNIYLDILCRCPDERGHTTISFIDRTQASVINHAHQTVFMHAGYRAHALFANKSFYRTGTLVLHSNLFSWGGGGIEAGLGVY